MRVGNVSDARHDPIRANSSLFGIGQRRSQKIGLNIGRLKPSKRKSLEEVQAQNARSAARIENSTSGRAVKMQPPKKTIDTTLKTEELHKEVVSSTAFVEGRTDHGLRAALRRAINLEIRVPSILPRITADVNSSTLL